MADEVVIRLRGSSEQLEASLQRLSNSMNRLGTQTQATQAGIQQSVRRTTARVVDQNKSFTLMIAKLALVAFAVQTMANIFKNTFGAVLKNIDDFNIAAIGTASAITAITSETNRPIGDVFIQNLEATKQIFEDLEFVAADFFSSGAELQLAFNTLAQRGVIVREDEFRILGKLTDQIKLLTGGQNTQIQIQQELRAILDGNVRTTTAFAKSLQARGVDVQQLSREVQATGSLKPFEPFLTGLDAASGAIRRTLTSVLSTFGSLTRVLGRNIFEDTYDGVVQTITNVNNLIISQRGELVAVGKIIVENVLGGAKRLLNVFTQFANVVGDVVADDLLRLLAIITVVSKLSSGPVRIFLLMGVALEALTGNIADVDKAFNILIGTMRILLKTFAEVVKESVSGFQQLARKFNFGVATNSLKTLKSELAGLDNLLARTGTQGEDRDSALKRRAEVIREITLAEQALFDAAAQSVATETRLRIEALEVLEQQNILSGEGKQELEKLRNIAKDIPFDDSISQGLTEIENQVNSLLENLGLDPVAKRLTDVLADLRKELGAGKKKTTADVNLPTQTDTRIVEAERERARSRQDLVLQSEDKARQGFFQQEIKRINLLAAERSITGKEAFDQELAQSNERARLDQIALEAEKKLVQERAKEDIAIVNANVKASQGPTRIQDEIEGFLKIIKIRQDETKGVLSIEEKIAESQRKQVLAQIDASKTRADEALKVNRILQQRDQDLRNIGGQTNADIKSGIGLGSANARSDFAAANQADQAKITRFNKQQDSLDLLKSVQPQIDAFTKAIDDTFQTLINGIVDGSFEFRDLANSLSKDLIKSGLQELIAQAKDAVVKGLTSIFEIIGSKSAQVSAQALALGLGVLLAVLSKAGNDGSFTATGGSGGGSSVTGSRQVQGIVGGDTSIPIAEINIGLQEALIPTNNLLSQIERNTRSLADLNVSIDPSALQGALTAKLDAFFQQMVLQNP